MFVKIQSEVFIFIVFFFFKILQVTFKTELLLEIYLEMIEWFVVAVEKVTEQFLSNSSMFEERKKNHRRSNRYLSIVR